MLLDIPSPEPRRDECFLLSAASFETRRPHHPDCREDRLCTWQNSQRQRQRLSGQTVMLTKRGQRKAVSAYDADDTTKRPTMMIVGHAGPSSA
jgi:hypothetical protein